MEKVVFNSQGYTLIGNGSQLGEQGGKIVFLKGEETFDRVLEDVKSAKSITILDSLGEPLQIRTDLVYAGQLMQDDHYTVGAEQVQTGTDEETGDPIYQTRDVIGTVFIASFRQPDVREQMAAMQAKLEYMAMMTNVELEV